MRAVPPPTGSLAFFGTAIVNQEADGVDGSFLAGDGFMLVTKSRSTQPAIKSQIDAPRLNTTPTKASNGRPTHRNMKTNATLNRQERPEKNKAHAIATT